MTDNYSPNLFLFQSYITEMLEASKAHIKTAPFDNIDPKTVFNDQKSQFIDMYHSYFLAAMGHAKTREISCRNYQKLLRQGLIDKQRLPVSMVSSILTACSNFGGSTSGSSSLGSASLNNSTQTQSLYIGNLIKSILLHTYQPVSQIIVGLNYLLEGSRKKFSPLYCSMLQEVYSNFLVRFRQPPVKRLVQNYLNGLLDEVQAHFEDEGYTFATRKMDQQSGKVDMPLFPEKNGFGKFGRCFMCKNEAFHYMKEEFIPICSISCKDKVNQLLQQCKNNEQFSVLGWVLDNIAVGDDIIYTFLLKELQYMVDRHSLSSNQLVSVLKSMIQHLGVPNLSRTLLATLTLIITNWKRIIPSHQISYETAETLQIYYKTYYLQILGLMEQWPISKDLIDYISFFSQIIRNQDIFMGIFRRYDCHFFQPNILGRMLNLMSQYAKKYDFAIDGLHNLTKALVKKYIQRRQTNQNWPCYGEFIKKKELKKVIALFNKKPIHGIKYLKKLFEVESGAIESKESISSSQLQSSTSLEKEALDQITLQPQIQKQQQNQDANNHEEVTENNQQIYSEHKQQIQLQKPQQERTNRPGQELPEQMDRYSNKQQQSLESNQNQQPKLKQQEQKVQIPHEQEKIVIKQNKSIKTRITPFHIALFIRQNTQVKAFLQSDNRIPIQLPTLSQVKVGQYFGLNDPQVRQVCLAYLFTFDFDGYHFDDMMRMVLNSFSLPKQTQMVERVIEDISKRLVGLYQLKNDTMSYQYFYLLLMVQTTNHNPNVRDSQKLKLDSFLAMCKSMMNGWIPTNAEADYQRIIENTLNLRMKYNQETIFTRKYLGELEKHSRLLFQDEQIGNEPKSLLLYIWQYLVIGLVWPGNTKGLYESIIILGRQDLAAEQKTFFDALRKEGPNKYTRDVILKIGIQHGNELHGDLWNTVISLIFSLQNENQFHSLVLDRLFTNSVQLIPARLQDFLKALLQFSKSEIKSDSHYTRQLFVLRNINSLLEYNIPRFFELGPFLWPLLQDYFKDICLHPRREISMAAIDSLKQLTLKLLKLRNEAIRHDALMETFLHIFERSCLEMKDLIANVLLNLITVDLRGGWESLYEILNVLDTKDKQLVVRILSRLVGQVGLDILTNLPKLHAICIKELRVCSDAATVEQILQRLWQLSQFINQPITWLETIRSIKDIYKISLSSDLLQVFIRMCNRCLSRQVNAEQLERDIFEQIVDLLVFLMELKGNQNKIITTLITSLQMLMELNTQFMIKYLGGSCGFLSIFQLYLGSQLKVSFVIFLKKYINKVLLPIFINPQHNLQFQQLCLWCINQYYDNLPLELINFKESDTDFEKTLSTLLKETNKEKNEGSDLVQFSLSHKDYYEKSILHLAFLDIVQQIYRMTEGHTAIRQKIILAVIDSYDCAVRINKLIILRNFLWNNGFLKSKNLPGLHKQEHRTRLFIVQQFHFSKKYNLLSSFINQYLNTTKHRKEIKNNEGRQFSKGDNRNKEKQYKNYSVYSNDASLWLNQAQKSLSVTFSEIRQELSKSMQQNYFTNQRSELGKLVNQCTSLLEITTLPKIICFEVSETLKILYGLIL